MHLKHMVFTRCYCYLGAVAVRPEITLHRSCSCCCCQRLSLFSRFRTLPPPPPPHRPPLPHTHTHIHFVYSVYLFFYCCSAGLPKFWSTTIFITTLSRYNLTIVQEISLSLISLSSSTVIRRQSVVYCVFTGAFAHMIFSFPFYFIFIFFKFFYFN